MRRVVFSDFDGTITEEENFVALLRHFSPEAAARLLPGIYARRVSLRQGVREMLEAIPSRRFPEMLDFVRGKALRGGFEAFLDDLARHEVPLVVISSGLVDLVETTLGPLRSQVAAIYGATVDRSGPTLRVHSDWEGGDELVAKPRIIALYAGAEQACIGDSVTDLEMARACPLVFARDKLADYLKNEGLPFVPFEDFHDVRARLAARWWGRP